MGWVVHDMKLSRQNGGQRERMRGREVRMIGWGKGKKKEKGKMEHKDGQQNDREM